MKGLRVIAAALLCVMLTGCTDLSLNEHDLLIPPRAEGSHAEIQSLIEASAGGSYSLIYPSAGKYTGAVTLHDIDGDETEEAVALYKRRNGGVRVLFAGKARGRYEVICETDLDAALINSISFADLNGDGREEFLIHYPVSGSPQACLSVIEPDKEAVRADLPSAGSAYLSGDFNADGISELMLLSTMNTVTTATARLVAYEGGAFRELGSCETDSQVTGYARLRFGGIGDGVSGAVLDGVNAAGEYTTQVIYYDAASGSLSNPLFLFGDYEHTRRSAAITSTDVDRDEVIELPIVSFADHAQDEDMVSVCRKVTWSSFSPSILALTAERTSLLCDSLGFLFNLSSDRVGAVTARYADDATVCFYSWEFIGGELSLGTKLLTIRRYRRSEYNSGYVIEAKLCETSADVYTYVIEDSEHYLSFTDDEVTDSFALVG
jgi:hypothetical protein